MRYFRALLVMLILIPVNSCSEGPGGSEEPKSDEAELINLELASDDDYFTTTISGAVISVPDSLPYGIEEVAVKTLEVSPLASVNMEVDTVLDVSQGPFDITVTAEDGISHNTYELRLEVKQSFDYEYQLFENYTSRECSTYGTIDMEGYMIENNLWNADALAAGSFSQCVYAYEKYGLQISGWEWQFPSDAYGVNAYPEIIYGWKPWYSRSTTQVLPKQISAISKVKVVYDAEISHDDGDYNLAFDNWINSSSSVKPENIEFEFMIWEDCQNMFPFGDYQEDVTTTNGTYEFYMGEPTWEPQGCDWTYVAFKRKTNRTSGTVDVDELLDYLVNEGIVSQDSYLASVELGNEVCNSTGKTILKEFRVEVE